MKIAVECSNCKKATQVDVYSLIKTLLDCADNQSIYSGFLCEDCAHILEEET